LKHSSLGPQKGFAITSWQSCNWKIFVGIAACSIAVFSRAQESPRPKEERSSISPDKKWEYKLVDGNRPAIVEAGTIKIVSDLSTLDVPNPDVTEVVWAPDSKRFAFNYQAGTRYQTTALFQLYGNEWHELDSPESDATTKQLDGSIKAQKKKLKLSPQTRGRPIITGYQIRKWIDSSTALLYAHSEKAFDIRNDTESASAAFFFTLKFDPTGDWKIVRTYELGTKGPVGMNNVEGEEIKRIDKEEEQETSTIGDHIYHHR
jgi:hypothetical protein